MKLYQKVPKPISYEPSAKLAELANECSVTNMPIADVACGYGRNGAFFVCQGFPVYFVDMDNDCLEYISRNLDIKGTSDIPTRTVQLLNLDLTYEWPFAKESLGGIICVHFYYPGLIHKWLKSIVHSGFFYLETIDARSSNASILPFKNEILSELGNDFDIKYYVERSVKNVTWQNKVSCVTFAVKK